MALASDTAHLQGSVIESPGRERLEAGSWWQRSGISGKLLFFGGIAGVLFTFFPAVSATVSTKFSSESARELVLASLPGLLGLVAYITCIVYAFRLYPATPAPISRKRLMPVLICGGGVVLMALWILISALTAESRIMAEVKAKFTSAGLGELADMVKISTSVGMGAYLIFFSALAVAAGAGLKAKEEELF
jgi:hypothetical protein